MRQACSLQYLLAAIVVTACESPQRVGYGARFINDLAPGVSLGITAEMLKQGRPTVIEDSHGVAERLEQRGSIGYYFWSDGEVESLTRHECRACTTAAVVRFFDGTERIVLDSLELSWRAVAGPPIASYTVDWAVGLGDTVKVTVLQWEYERIGMLLLSAGEDTTPVARARAPLRALVFDRRLPISMFGPFP